MGICQGYLIEKNQLADFIINDYYLKKDRYISPIKLQKSLYFLYVEWLKFLSNSNVPEARCGQIELPKELNKELFEPNFQAWPYGPVDKDIYHAHKYDNPLENIKADHSISFESIIENYDSVKVFIDDLLMELYDVSDFRLVDLTHQHKCWIDNKGCSISRESMREEFYDYP